MKKSVFTLGFAALLAGTMLVSCDSKPANTETASEETEAAAEVSDVLTIDAAASSVAWLGKKVTGEHNGTVAVQSGELQLSGDQIVGGTFTIDMTSIVNEDLKDEEYNGKLVGHLKSDDFFGVETYPTSTLVITKVTSKGGNDYEVVGNLTIKEKTNAITFPATITKSEDGVSATATLVFDRSKFDVKYGSGSFFDNLGDNLIYDDVALTINMVAKK
jgi:polyisoprenoid-binding protein YceI